MHIQSRIPVIFKDFQPALQKPTIYTHESIYIITGIYAKLELQLQVNNAVYVCARSVFNYQNHCTNTLS